MVYEVLNDISRKREKNQIIAIPDTKLLYSFIFEPPKKAAILFVIYPT